MWTLYSTVVALFVLLFLYLYSDDLELFYDLLCARVCMSHALCERFKKGSEFLLHWWKFTLEDEAARESHFPCTEEEEEEDLGF